VRRPVDYDKFPNIEPNKPIPRLDVSSVGIISTQVEDSPYKLFIGGLPHEMQEDQVKTMLNRFGQLKSFHLVKERSDKNSKGYAFCEFLNEDSTIACVNGLNNITMGHRTINVKRSGTPGMSQSSAGPSGDSPR
jgi:splicing factor U2AF 65 kDa subunit